MAIRKFEYTLQLDSGLLIPASAGEGKVFTSDGSGNGTWQARPKKPYITAHTWVWRRAEAVATETVDGPIIRLAAGETVSLVSVDYKIFEGTEAEFKLQKKNAAGAAEDVEGYTALKAKTTQANTASAKTLAAADELLLVVITATGTPKGLRVTVQLEHSN